jgi:hypothetical protein
MTYNAGSTAIAKWNEDFDALRLSYDRSALHASQLAFIRVEHLEETKGADENTLYTLLSIAFVALHDRGAIQPIRPYSQEGEEQLAELLASYRVVSGPAPVDEAREQLTLKEQVLQDFRTMPSKEFGEKFRTNDRYRAQYERLIADGTIK